MKSDVDHLAAIIKQRNRVAKEIAIHIGRPALIGHVGEYIASLIFDIQLAESASQKSIDGYFQTGSLAGKSVDVKWYGKREGLLDMKDDPILDYYLVLTGPKTTATSSRFKLRPWIISSVYLFDAKTLVSELKAAGRKIGVATSVKQVYWNRAEIYPRQQNSALNLTHEQREMIALFDHRD